MVEGWEVGVSEFAGKGRRVGWVDSAGLAAGWLVTSPLAVGCDVAGLPGSPIGLATGWMVPPCVGTGSVTGKDNGKRMLFAWTGLVLTTELGTGCGWATAGSVDGDGDAVGKRSGGPCATATESTTKRTRGKNMFLAAVVICADINLCLTLLHLLERWHTCMPFS